MLVGDLWKGGYLMAELDVACPVAWLDLPVRTIFVNNNKLLEDELVL